MSDPAAAHAEPAEVAASIFDHLEHAWNRHDGAAFAAVFADETDFVDIRGEHHHGDPAMIDIGHQALFDSIYADSAVRYRVEHARRLEGGCIVAIAASILDAPHGPLQGQHEARMTAVLVADARRWRITAFQNTLVTNGGDVSVNTRPELRDLRHRVVEAGA